MKKMERKGKGKKRKREEEREKEGGLETEEWGCKKGICSFET